jgi:DNA adenine methylase
MRTFIRWQGNKSKHIKKFQEYLPKEFNTYIEPFVGSGALLLAVKPDKWIINDINTDLITLWKLVQNDPDFILRTLAKYENTLLQIKEKGHKIAYARHLFETLDKRKNQNMKSIILLFLIYHTYMSFLSGRFPGLDMYGMPKSYEQNLRFVHEYLKTTQGNIYNTNYTDVLKLAKTDDFVFVDPPYFELKNYDFVYNQDESNMHVGFLSNLAKELAKLDKKKVKWLMTQADTPEVRKIFDKYDIHTYKAFRVSGQVYKTELVIRNYA